jgi:hypothetical protein
MVEYDNVDVQIREYQWRRKFDSRTQYHCRALIVLPMIVLLIVVLACSTYWW